MLKTIFEDPNLIVLSKPAGILSQGDSSGDTNVVDILREKFGRPYVGLVHRLDRNVSGIMVVAKRTKAASRLSENLKKGALIRKYKGWLLGEVRETRVLENFLVKNEATNEVRVVESVNVTGAKRARLTLKPLEVKEVGAKGRDAGSGEKITLCEFELDTGRAHQIRVQSAAAGHPLLGDPKYGKKAEAISQRLGLTRPALHSYFISFPHPISKEWLTFTEPLPEELRF